jgi:hypothetical protein
VYTLIGLFGTVLWALIGGYYVFSFIGAREVVAYGEGELGLLLIGVFAPLALLWMVVGYLRYGALLDRNVRALEAQGEELRTTASILDAQAHAILASVQYGRRQDFLRLAELIGRDLNAIAVGIARALGGGELLDRTLAARRGGHEDAFFELLVRSFSGQELDHVIDTLGTTPGYPETIDTFLDKFDHLVREAEAADPGGYLPRHYATSAMAKLAAIFRDVRDHGAGVGPRDEAG